MGSPSAFTADPLFSSGFAAGVGLDRHGYVDAAVTAITEALPPSVIDKLHELFAKAREALPRGDSAPQLSAVFPDSPLMAHLPPVAAPSGKGGAVCARKLVTKRAAAVVLGLAAAALVARYGVKTLKKAAAEARAAPAALCVFLTAIGESSPGGVVRSRVGIRRAERNSRRRRAGPRRRPSERVRALSATQPVLTYVISHLSPLAQAVRRGDLFPAGQEAGVRAVPRVRASVRGPLFRGGGRQGGLQAVSPLRRRVGGADSRGAAAGSRPPGFRPARLRAAARRAANRRARRRLGDVGCGSWVHAISHAGGFARAGDARIDARRGAAGAAAAGAARAGAMSGGRLWAGVFCTSGGVSLYEVFVMHATSSHV